MTLFTKTLTYFRELSQIPRPSHHEEGVRQWLIKWADSHGWSHKADTIGNLLMTATSAHTATHPHTTLCLQAHMDMVCVSEKPHDWSVTGVTLIEENGVLRGDETSLGADNGIGVAIMMALAEERERPDLELLFTMAEEVGLIGAHQIDLPLTARYGINLDWCDSTTLGIGCGGTLLMEGKYPLQKIEKPANLALYRLSIGGMRGGHSGVDILDTRGNALIELIKIITERDDILGICEVCGGDADNAIPRSAYALIMGEKNNSNLQSWLDERTHQLRDTTDTPTLSIMLGEIDADVDVYDKHILEKFSLLGSGVQIWSDDRQTPLSSWNLGKMQLSQGNLTWCHFIRTNIVGGIEPMRTTILTALQGGNFTLSHEGPVWLTDPDSHFIAGILSSITKTEDTSIPAMTTHATMESGVLAEKFPQTQWVSFGATCHNMHTTREHIYLCDLEEFCERLKNIIHTMYI